MHIGSKLCRQSDLGIGGLLYGGRLLEWLAEQAAIHAMKQTGAPHLVGYRFDEIVIRRPVRAGEILDYEGDEPVLRTTSATFTVTVRTGGELVMSGRCTFVAVGPDGRKEPLPRPAAGA